MPNQDGTGPRGTRRAGRGLGTCGRIGTTGNSNNSLVTNLVGILYEVIRSLITKKNQTQTGVKNAKS